MTHEKLEAMFESAFEDELLAEECEGMVDEDLKAFEASLAETEAPVETEPGLEALEEELSIDLGELEPASETEGDTALNDLIAVLKKYPGLKITLSF